MGMWFKRLGFVALGLVAVLGTGKLILEIRDRSDPVDVGQIAKDFEHKGTTTTGVSGPTQLANGVWLNSAKGTEYIDLLGGPMHQFPPEVAQSVVPTACGQTITVQLFEQREDVLDLCRDASGRLLVNRFGAHHEFAGVKDQSDTTGFGTLPLWWPGMEKDVGTPPVTVTATANGTMIGETPVKATVEVVGVEKIDVGGTPVDTVHVQLTNILGTPNSSNYGNYVMGFWFSLDQAVIVHRTLDAKVAAQTPLGTLGFEETFDITVKSLQPASG